MLIDGRKKKGSNKLKTSKAFIVYSQTIDNDYENLENYNPTKKRRVLTVFGDMIADIESNKKLIYCYRIVFKSMKTQYI